MAFIRGKRKKDCVYYYVVENVREGGKVRQNVLAYLGKCPTIEAAISYWTEYLKEMKSKVERLTPVVERVNNGKPFEHRRYNRWWRSEIVHNYNVKELQQAKKYVAETTERLRKIREAASKVLKT